MKTALFFGLISLFRIAGIVGNTVREAKLLAGCVHGYFYSLTYTNRSVPHDHLVTGYLSDQPLAAMMATTHYVHAGTAIMTGRERNIEAAFTLVPT